MGALGIVEQITIGQQSAISQETACLFQDLLLLWKLAEVMQGLNGYDGVDISFPPHLDKIRGPVVIHKIDAVELHHAADSLFTRDCFEAAAGAFEQVRREIEAAIAEAWQLAPEDFSQKAGTAGQFNDPRGAG